MEAEMKREEESDRSKGEPVALAVENTSGQGSLAVIPEEIRGWSWGAFVFGWLWGVCNNVWIALLGLIPYVSVIVAIVLGVKGNEWAWRHKKWDSVEHFKRTQRTWNKCGVGLLALGVLLVGAALIIPSVATNPRYIYENGTIHVGADGEPIELFNNPSSRNPTYAELIAFIRTDDTDAKRYLERRIGGWQPFVCADFAEAVHNNAEGAGIRAAWVSIDLAGEEVGHALNAFETTDKGLAYIDCTGAALMQQGVQRLQALLEGSPPPPIPTSRDALAYVEVGKEYGVIPLDQAKSLSYSFYEQYKKRWHESERQLANYNAEVSRFNQEIAGRTYIIGSPEWEKMKEWEASLKAQEEELNKLGEGLSNYWLKPLGIVKDIKIHWGEE